MMLIFFTQLWNLKKFRKKGKIMKIEFLKEISDINRFEKIMKDFYSGITSIAYNTTTKKGIICVPDNTPTVDRNNILYHVADYSNTLTEEEQSINYVDNILKDAYFFGQELKQNFINENVRLGITQLGKTKYVRTTMREVNECIETMSLKDAVDECQLILDDLNGPDGTLDKECPIINMSRINNFANKIKVYLGI